MISSNTYSFTWIQALLFACLLAFILPAQALTEAASVLFSHGNVVLTNDAGSYPLEKDATVSAGDTVITGEDGRIQMRFSDGGLVSLMPNSRFAVEEYSQPTASSEGSASVNLLKGGMRALSGSIGKKDHDSYKLKTDVATLGIRGTQFVVVLDGAAMRVHVGQGSVALFNDFGELLVPTGRHAEVFPGQAPAISMTPPVFVSAAKPSTQNTEEQQNEANQDPATTNQYVATDVMRTLDPYIINSEKEGDTSSVDDNDTPPVVVTPPKVEPPLNGDNGGLDVPHYPDTETYDGGFAYALAGQNFSVDINNPSSEDHQIFNPETAALSVEVIDMLELTGEPESIFTGGQSGFPLLSQQAMEDAVTTAGGLTWTESIFEFDEVGNTSKIFMYQAYVWGDTPTNIPMTGTLNYSLKRDDPFNVSATPVRTISNNMTYQNELFIFDLEIQLGSQTKFKSVVQAGSAGGIDFNQDAAVNGYLNYDSGEFKFTAANSSNCPSCVLNAAGFLSGDYTEGQGQGQRQAGVVYFFKDNDGLKHTGGAVLDEHVP